MHRLATPTAFTAFTECPHSTTLDLAGDTRGEKRPRASGEFFDLITRKGNEHECAYYKKLKASGRDITDIPSMKDGADRARELTLEAMRRGDDVIYQACLTMEGWRGAADFLVRVPLDADLGAWGYEPIDTKLARKEALPHHILQLSYYAEAIAEIQGRLPEEVHVELGSGEPESVRTREVIHYARHQRRRFERFVENPAPTVAYPNSQCVICAHRSTCEKAWREEDHPSFVAGIRRGHVLDLAVAEPPITTLTALAALPDDASIAGIKEHTLANIRRQAQLQRASIEHEEIVWEFREREPGSGYDLLPEPNEGDIYLDLEGDPVWRPDRSLVFLYGWIQRGADDEWEYQTIWAHDEASERAAYDELVARILERRKQYPDMHVFHYSHAETSMLRAIAAIDMDEIEQFEDLIASGVFIDLYKVVRQGLRVGVESYGLKSIEKLAGFERKADVDGGSDAVVLYEKWMKAGDQTLLDKIASYNDEDCRATRKVHEWLLAHPATGEIREREEYEPSESAIESRAEFERREQLALNLRAAFPDDPGMSALGSMLNFHAREDRFDIREIVEMWNLPLADRLDDGRVVTGLTPVEDPTLTKGETAYTYPPQDHKVQPGTAMDIDASDWTDVSVKSVDERARRIVVAADHQVTALCPKDYFSADPMASALKDVATSCLAGSDEMACAKALVRRDLPLIDGTSATVHIEQPTDTDEAVQAEWLDAVCARALALSGGPLSIQGPPGTGKTWLAAQIILRLMQAGNTVALTGPSHNAIGNACKQLVEVAEEAQYDFRGERICRTQQKLGLAPRIKELTSSAKFDDAVARGIQFAAGTQWACARPAARESFDYLVIDEAGQFGVADAIAAATIAKKGVILVGDPLQLPQVAQARHEEGSGLNVLEYILGDDKIIPDDRGILLTITRRMHPDVCDFISEHIYEGRLGYLPELANQNTAIGTGIRWIDVEHTGCSARSREEAEVVREEALALIGTKWTDSKGEQHDITAADIMVVAPYNAQVREIKAELATHPDTVGIEVGTVDKFQGGEAPIVFFSMATSSEDDLSRDKDFLFSKNRLNVALSRAQCVASIVASPTLMDTTALTLNQLRLLSMVCAATKLTER
jgi:uncharacterized protein